jgi:RNA-directed DNA polymerase
MGFDPFLLCAPCRAHTLEVKVPGFSGASYGFRPGRSAHNAVNQAREYVRDGRRWVVDLDLDKFFDRVNHDILMARVASKVKDKRVLLLIRKFLQAGVMEEGLR